MARSHGVSGCESSRSRTVVFVFPVEFFKTFFGFGRAACRFSPSAPSEGLLSRLETNLVCRHAWSSRQDLLPILWSPLRVVTTLCVPSTTALSLTVSAPSLLLAFLRSSSSNLKPLVLTIRGQVATQEEKDSAMDLIYQLEALNPTPDATNVNTIGDSDFCLTRPAPACLGSSKTRLFFLHRRAEERGGENSPRCVTERLHWRSSAGINRLQSCLFCQPFKATTP